MTTILKLTTSINSAEGESSRLASQFVKALQERDPGAQLIERDLARQPGPHLDAERFQAFLAAPAARTPAQAAAVAYSDQLIAELRRADVLVLGLPMYNFGVPSQLKAWFDHVARAGVTFRYTDKGSVGLLGGRKAYVFATRGGRYAGAPADTQTSYVRDFLRFLGIDEVEFVHAEGLALGAAEREATLTQARAAIRHLAAPVALAA
jgi:FMN-dependent NADH-azoreductase